MWCGAGPVKLPLALLLVDQEVVKDFRSLEIEESGLVWAMLSVSD